MNSILISGISAKKTQTAEQRVLIINSSMVITMHDALLRGSIIHCPLCGNMLMKCAFADDRDARN